MTENKLMVHSHDINKRISYKGNADDNSHDLWREPTLSNADRPAS